MVDLSSHARVNVRAAIESLSDPEHQRQRWGVVVRRDGGVSYDDLDLVVHVLYDDFDVLPDPTRWVSTAVFAAEVESLIALDAQLGPLLDDLGGAPDEVYLADPRWGAVVDAARRVVAAMNAAEAAPA